MKQNNHPVFIVILLLAATLLPVHTQTETVHDTSYTLYAQYQQNVPVTRNTGIFNDISTFDPARAADPASLDVAENLFSGLTDYDPYSGAIVPEIALSWSQSTDHLTWTFELRDDIYWMHYQPDRDNIETLRSITAEDFVYSIKRACDPRAGGYYSAVLAQVIAGCDVINLTPEETITDALVYGDTVQVYAPSPDQLVIQLQAPISYFLEITPLPVMRPVPRESIEQHGENWTDVGNIVTSGPYFLQHSNRGVQYRFIRNQDFPADLLHSDGNIEIIVLETIENTGTAFALYQEHLLDQTVIPAAEFESVLNEQAQEVVQLFDYTVYFVGFNYNQPPFDDVHVRRAFSSILNRQTLIEQVLNWRGIPLIHLSPPGLPYAPPINEIGVGFDVDYAVEEMARSPYPECRDFPELTVLADPETDVIAEFWLDAAVEYLGCDAEKLTVEQREFTVVLEYTSPDAPANQRPGAWILNHGADYADLHNWFYTVISCESLNRTRRPCSEVDSLITLATYETDVEERTRYYAEIEQILFGLEGEFPIAPLFMNTETILVKPWYTGPFQTDNLFTGQHWEAYHIDMFAKQASQ